MAKAAKPDTAQAASAAPKKSKAKLIIIVVALLVVLGGGVVAFLLLKPAHPPKLGGESGAGDEHASEQSAYVPATYVDLGTFTANLVQEEGDRYLQVAISLKITKPELTDRIKASNPEILHRVNMLLQSKRPSVLASVEGKQKLADQIKAQVEYVLGYRKTAPLIVTQQAENEVSDAPEVPAGDHVIKTDIADVLFTSFIIQ
ncbi:MAG: flagellar basal body-associated FliL family protein [Nitrosomonadales bacterium]|nr:flagellar basal body-associated FliL family protein [Nitrosomonadales bacterium]